MLKIELLCTCYMNHVMRKPFFFFFAYAKTKAQISFTVTVKLISAFVFATRTVQFLFFLNPNFQASRLHRLICVAPGWKPKGRFPCVAAHIQLLSCLKHFVYFFFFFWLSIMLSGHRQGFYNFSVNYIFFP